jgi:flagellar biosynthetic protein FliO
MNSMDTTAVGIFDVARSLVSLIVVLGLMGGAYYWLKRRGNLPGTAGRRLRVIERLPIDTRRSVLLLQLDDEELVVGVGTDSITPILTRKKGSDDEA